MTEEAIATTVEVLGKTYQIKCPEKDASSLQEAARYLEEKMRAIRTAMPALAPDRLAVLTALNISHQFLNFEQVKAGDTKAATERLRHLYNRIDSALAQLAQMEL